MRVLNFLLIDYEIITYKRCKCYIDFCLNRHAVIVNKTVSIFDAKKKENVKLNSAA